MSTEYERPRNTLDQSPESAFQRFFGTNNGRCLCCEKQTTMVSNKRVFTIINKSVTVEAIVKEMSMTQETHGCQWTGLDDDDDDHNRKLSWLTMEYLLPATGDRGLRVLVPIDLENEHDYGIQLSWWQWSTRSERPRRTTEQPATIKQSRCKNKNNKLQQPQQRPTNSNDKNYKNKIMNNNCSPNNNHTLNNKDNINNQMPNNQTPSNNDDNNNNKRVARRPGNR